jgi:hypothetical protein
MTAAAAAGDKNAGQNHGQRCKNPVGTILTC